MKIRYIIRRVAALLCLALLAASFNACADGEKIEKQEVSEGSVWVFDDVRVTGETNAKEADIDSAGMSSVYARIVFDQHNVICFDDAMQMRQMLDTIEFKEGKVYICHYEAEGNPSFINGNSVYSEYTQSVTEIGTYSGTEISVSYNDYTEVYIADNELILRSIASEEGVRYVCDAVFVPMG